MAVRGAEPRTANEERSSERRRRVWAAASGALIPTAPGKARGADPRGPSPVDAADRRRDAAAPEAPATVARGPRRRRGRERAGRGGVLRRAAAGLRSRPNPRQPREVFDEDALAELVASIREVGLLQPVVVRPIGPDRYELIMGERRWRAAQEAGLDAIPAIVRATDDDDAAARRAAGEPAPRPAQPAGGGRGLRPAAAGLRLHARRAGRPDRPVAAADLQHAAAAQAAARGPAPGGGRRALGRARPGPARAGRPGRAGAAGPADRGRGAVGARGRGDRGARRRAGRARPRAAPRAEPVAPALADLADRLVGPVRDPGEGRPGPDARARSWWSSPPSRTWSGSWR